MRFGKIIILGSVMMLLLVLLPKGEGVSGAAAGAAGEEDDGTYISPSLKKLMAEGQEVKDL